MEIVHDMDGNRFVGRADDGTRIGEIGYAVQDGRVVALHTNVDDAFRGQGAAGQLLDALADYAEDKGMKIVPMCSYVAAAFERSPHKYQTVIE